MMSQAAAAFVRPAAPAAVPARVECVDTALEFAALRSSWNLLLRNSAADGPFLTWEWLHSWWQHLHGRQQLRIAVVRSGSDLIGIAPLLQQRSALAPLRRLDFLGTGLAGSDYLDVIARRGHEAETAAAIARFLHAQGMALRFAHVADDSMASRVAMQLTSQGWNASQTPDGTCPIIRLAGHTWDSYLATLGSAHRANVRRRLRGLDQAFDVHFEAATSDAARKEALAALIGFHAGRWGEGGSTAFLTPELRAFHDTATAGALERGWLRMYVLRLDGAIAAVMYGFFYNRQFYFYQHGFDEQYRAHSAGLALMALCIRAAIEEGAETFDMLWGTEAYKSLWAHEARDLRRFDLFPPHISGRLHRRAVEARRGLGRLVRRVLPREVVRGA